MALKLPDSAVPMGDFPVAKAVDIDFDDGENLQEKLDNGTLGGGGGSPEKQIKDWVSGSSYLEGDYIYHEGEIYRCLTSNSDVGFDETNWKKLTYGIDELSKEDVERLLGLTKEEIATMDEVKHGYVKIIKNDDTDADDAMIISYKNRDLFGIRMYKKDHSEHELKFNAGGIFYVKNGVTVWTTGVTTGGLNVPNTVIVSEDANVKLNSNCYYTVINGVCYVTLWGFTCAESGQYLVNSSMPKTRLTTKGVCTYGRNGHAGACAYVLYDGNGNNKLYVEVSLINEPFYGSFSYPVAE